MYAVCLLSIALLGSCYGSPAPFWGTWVGGRIAAGGDAGKSAADLGHSIVDTLLTSGQSGVQMGTEIGSNALQKGTDWGISTVGKVKDVVNRTAGLVDNVASVVYLGNVAKIPTGLTKVVTNTAVNAGQGAINMANGLGQSALTLTNKNAEALMGSINSGNKWANEKIKGTIDSVTNTASSWLSAMDDIVSGFGTYLHAVADGTVGAGVDANASADVSAGGEAQAAG